MGHAHDIIIKLCEQQRALFFSTGQRHTAHRQGAFTAQKSNTIAAPVKVYGRREDRIHPGRGSYIAQYISAAATVGDTVDLLHGNDIGPGRDDDTGYAADIANAIHADSIMDIITHDTNRVALRRDNSGRSDCRHNTGGKHRTGHNQSF